MRIKKKLVVKIYSAPTAATFGRGRSPCVSRILAARAYSPTYAVAGPLLRGPRTLETVIGFSLAQT